MLGALLHAALLLVVLAEVVYLSSRHRVRVDLTGDRLWTSTASTQRVLEKLDKQLVIEAYFSQRDALPVQERQVRDWIDNFLDELVQRGGGRVVVQRFDPNADKAVSDKATRLGIQPYSRRSQSTTSLSFDQHWQGLRLVYGGGEQQVIENLAPGGPFDVEALITPRIKEVLTDARPVCGYIEWPAERVDEQRPGGVGWSVVRTHELIAKRYDFKNYKDADGALLPDDLETLFLFRPKDLTDRQKYVLDQFLMKGGTLVVFADAAEYAIGPQRRLTSVPLSIDAKGSGVPFADQLRNYGLEWRPKVVADMADQAYRLGHGKIEYLAVRTTVALGRQDFAPVPYPYFFHPVAGDWAQAADVLATDPATGRVDQRLAEQYRQSLHPGLPADDFLFDTSRQSGRGPGLYWPTWTGLRTRAGGVADLPDGIEGRVMMWSSPRALVEDPPQSLDPLGRDPQQYEAQALRFFRKLGERLQAETRRQVPLMAEVRGEFSSFWANRERPLRPSEQAARDAAGDDEGGDADPGAGAGEAGAEPPDEFGPPAPPDRTARGRDDATVPNEPDPIAVAGAPGRIVLIGDATFVRDDVLRGEYAQLGGPVSGGRALRFFLNLVDWLNEDQDLIALQSRTATDRSMTLVEPNSGPGADPRDSEQRLRSKVALLVWGNVLLPCALLFLFGLVVWVTRRAQKRRFLASLT